MSFRALAFTLSLYVNTVIEGTRIVKGVVSLSVPVVLNAIYVSFFY